MDIQQQNYKRVIEILGAERVDLNQPLDDLLIQISRRLSLQCRYGGHTSEFYSVAQHAVLASYMSSDPLDALITLHHDDTEAFLPDLISPIKDLFPLFNELEEALAAELAKKLNIPTLMNSHIKTFDSAMLVYEWKSFSAYPEDRYKEILNRTPPELTKFLTPDLQIVGLAPEAAAAWYIARHQMLANPEDISARTICRAFELMSIKGQFFTAKGS